MVFVVLGVTESDNLHEKNMKGVDMLKLKTETRKTVLKYL